MNIILLGFLYVSISLGLSMLGLFAVRRFVRPERLRPHHDVAGFLIAIIGVIYAVLLAFVVIVAWEQFERADQHASQEANAALSAYRLAHILPDAPRAVVRQDLENYATSAIHNEWPAMEQGKESMETQQALDRTWEDVIHHPPTTAAGLSLYPSLTGRLDDMTSYRLLRLVDSRTGVPALLWAVLLFGGAATVGFTYFFSLENRTVQVLMTALLSVMIGLILFLISAINFPFTGDLKVGPEAMTQVEEEMRLIEAEGQAAHLPQEARHTPHPASAMTLGRTGSFPRRHRKI